METPERIAKLEAKVESLQDDIKEVKEKNKSQKKVEKVMHEFKERKLHSGSKKGPEVTNPKQAVAIALSEARKKGMKVPKKK